MENNGKSTVQQYLSELVNSDLPFSDIRLESNAPIMIKASNGGWVNADILDMPTTQDMHAFMEELEPQWEGILKERGSFNRPLALVGWRLRVNGYIANRGETIMASIRRIPKKPLPLKQTGLPIGVQLLLESGSGLILISGATGSGKSTSMASLVQAINETKNHHIVTIEDPIEFVHEASKSIFSQREIGVDTQSFCVGVKDAMRQRPDVIVIGEILDRETAEQALLAGESGHLVIGSLHANSAVGTIGKFLGFFNSNEREAKGEALESCLIGIINQILLPRANGNGQVLAVDFIANHKREFSGNLTKPDMLQGMLDRTDKKDGISVSIGDCVEKFITDGTVNKADAARILASNSKAYDRIKNARSPIQS